jgi:hypothetical protein
MNLWSPGAGAVGESETQKAEIYKKGLILPAGEASGG